MASPTAPDSPKDFVELTPVFRGGENQQRNVAKVYDSELCMLALPPDEQQLLSRVSQFLFYRGIIPVVVRSPSEALIHSRHSRFAVIILPDNDPVLIRKVRSADGMNYGTPVIVISSAPILPDSTLHMLGTNEIQEAIYRTTNSEKLEADLISALNHVIGQPHHIGDPGMSVVPFPVQTTWSTVPPHYTSAAMPPIPFHHFPGPGLPGPSQQSATNSTPTEIPTRLSPTQMQLTTACVNGLQIHGQMPSCESQQIQGAAVEQGVTKLCFSEPLTELVTNSGPAPTVKISSPLCTNSQENSEPLLPGIETLLNAIQVVEGGEINPANNQGDATFSKFTALQSPQSEETRAPSKRTRPRKTRRSSTPERQKLAMAAMSAEEDFESLNDSKSPLPAGLLAKKPYFLELDSYREALADDANASPVDRHNSKERHRRIRITKAAEFFKSVIPCMDPNMDKATAFHWTVHYMVFLRNAILKQDPPITPKLHQTFMEEWGGVFNFKDRAGKADEKQPSHT